jgi:hypothetical protein
MTVFMSVALDDAEGVLADTQLGGRSEVPPTEQQFVVGATVTHHPTAAGQGIITESLCFAEAFDTRSEVPGATEPTLGRRRWWGKARLATAGSGGGQAFARPLGFGRVHDELP